MNYQIEQAALSALLHKGPKKVLLVGLGAGVTLGTLLQVEGVEEVDVLEISSGAVKANHFFAEYNNHALKDRRVNIIVDDGRHFLARTQKKYDLILNTPSYSWVSGTANIFTQEFYNQARARLAPDGIFMVWLHLYSITPLDIKRFVKTVNSVFPNTSLWLLSASTDLIALGSEKPLTMDYTAIQKKLKYPKLADELARIARPVPESLLHTYLMAGKEVAEYAAGAEINTDNHPVMEFSIPRHLFTWNVNENIQSLIGRRYVIPVPLSGTAVKQGGSTAFPAIGVQSSLADWSSSTDFINVYDFQNGLLNRQSEHRLVLVKSPYTFEIVPYRNRSTSSDDLKSALNPLARGGEIKPGQFGGRPSYGIQHKRAGHIEHFVSWSCQKNNTLYLGRFRGPDSGTDAVKAWTSLASGLRCNEK